MQSEFDDFLCAGITYLMNRHKCTSFNNNKEAEGGNGNGGLYVKRTVLYSVHIIYLAHAHCCHTGTGIDVVVCCCSWQLVFWPASQQCYRIFSQGPCPATQELAYHPPAQEPRCRCPQHLPVRWPVTDRCYARYTRGPCQVTS